jgi:hypothetical protein
MREKRPNEACFSRAGGQADSRAIRSDSLLPQNGELTMLGEITHLQGIIDDLVVLTAEPHKLPPASEQVRTAMGPRARDGGMVLSSLGNGRGEKGTAFQGGIWGKKTKYFPTAIVGYLGAPAQVRGGMPRTQQ